MSLKHALVSFNFETKDKIEVVTKKDYELLEPYLPEPLTKDKCTNKWEQICFRLIKLESSGHEHIHRVADVTHARRQYATEVLLPKARERMANQKKSKKQSSPKTPQQKIKELKLSKEEMLALINELD